jgi:hypothetical protein
LALLAKSNRDNIRDNKLQISPEVIGHTARGARGMGELVALHSGFDSLSVT